MDGNASFNYRLLIPYKNNKKASKILKIVCYDRDLLLSNDKIGEVELDLTEPINDALLSHK